MCIMLLLHCRVVLLPCCCCCRNIAAKACFDINLSMLLPQLILPLLQLGRVILKVILKVILLLLQSLPLYRQLIQLPLLRRHLIARRGGARRSLRSSCEIERRRRGMV